MLHIGFGSGGTASAVAQHAVREITVAEISPEVLEVSGSVFSDINHGVLNDPRVRVRLNDGRNVLLARVDTGGDNGGGIAASTTTVDVLAVYGRQFQVVVPAQIGFSRGADMVVVDSGITSINQLKGKVLASSQFNEAEFFIRYLASEAGVPVKVLRDLDGRPSADELGLVFYEDAFVACDAYQHELAGKRPRLNGCVGWSPRTDEVVEASNGRAKVLVTNRNLLVVADILLVNKGFAQAKPDWVKGLVHGLLEGNRLVRENAEPHLDTIARALKWEVQETRDELAKVHLSNLPENIAFFEGTIDAAGSFLGIFQSSVLSYGSLIKNHTSAA